MSNLIESSKWKEESNTLLNWALGTVMRYEEIAILTQMSLPRSAIHATSPLKFRPSLPSACRAYLNCIWSTSGAECVKMKPRKGKEVKEEGEEREMKVLLPSAFLRHRQQWHTHNIFYKGHHEIQKGYMQGSPPYKLIWKFLFFVAPLKMDTVCNNTGVWGGGALILAEQHGQLWNLH